MWCCHAGTIPTKYEKTDLHVDLTVRDALSSSVGGRIECTTDADTPVHVEWYKDGSTALLALSFDRLIAYNVLPGSYTIIITDKHGNSVKRETTVSEGLSVPVICGYAVTHASSDTARNGKIEVHVKNASEFDFLWTSGVLTSEPVLKDVRPGTYFACPIGKNGDTVEFVHECKPAVVLASRVPLLQP